jgi:hypothetical protein
MLHQRLLSSGENSRVAERTHGTGIADVPILRLSRLHEARIERSD